MINAESNAVNLSIAVTEYETLRAAALGKTLPPEARAGLMLFLHAGMWGWARAVTAMLRPSGRPAPDHRTGRRRWNTEP